MITSIIGGLLIGGGLKGMMDNLLKPIKRFPREHTPVYLRK